MSLPEVHDVSAGDSLTVVLSIKDSAGAAVDLTGSTISASAKPADLTQPVTPSITVVNATGGVLELRFPATTFAEAAESVYYLSTRVTKGGDVQTVVEKVIFVKTSNLPPPGD